MKYVSAGVIIVLILGGLTYAFFGNRQLQQESPQQEQTGASVSSAVPPQEFQTGASAEDTIVVKDIAIGAGPEAKTGDTVSVQYTGMLLNGTKFDSSYDRGRPFSFTLGKGQVIQGWEQGILGMKVGGKRKLTIPPSLAYGGRSIPGLIPANSTLVFEIELLAVK